MNVVNHILRFSCNARSWIYEWFAVIGISLATNLTASRLIGNDGSYLIWPIVIVWLGFGAAALVYSQEFRKCEESKTRDKSKTPNADIAWDVLDLTPWLRWMFWIMMACLIGGVVLMVMALAGLQTPT